jgi:type I restriction enzyme R subunit
LKTLQEVVAGLNRDNFIVRQHRRAVEKYEKPDAWKTLDDETRDELLDEIAPLPSAKGYGPEEAKRFDLLMFSLQLALLKGSKSFGALKKQLMEIAAALENRDLEHGQPHVRPSGQRRRSWKSAPTPEAARTPRHHGRL